MSKTATRTLPDSPAGLAESVTILRTGGLVAFPTETVYGLGADARNSQAVRRIFTVKKRSPSNPLIVLVQDLATARRLVDLNEQAERLAAAFWPGALTLVLPLKDDAGLSPLLGGDRQTLGVRLPGNSVAARLLTAFGGPIAAPSANLSGMTSPTHAQHVLDQLGGRIDAVVDGGVSQAGVESTIIGLDGPAVLHRPGAIPTEAIEACLGAQLPPVAPPGVPPAFGPRLRLNATGRQPGELLLGFGDVAGADVNLSRAGDLVEAAANLFHALSRLEARQPTAIAVSPIPATGLGRAINDRLRRAAAARN